MRDAAQRQRRDANAKRKNLRNPENNHDFDEKSLSGATLGGRAGCFGPLVGTIRLKNPKI